MIRREDLRVVDDTISIEGIKDFEKHIDELLSTDRVLMAKGFEVLYVLYNSAISNYASKRYVSKMEKLKYSKIFYINKQDFQSDDEMRAVVDANHQLLKDSGYEVDFRMSQLFHSQQTACFELTVSW